MRASSKDLVLQRYGRGAEIVLMSPREARTPGVGDIPSLVRQARVRAGMSRAQIARSAGISRRRLIAIEHGVAVPSDVELAAIGAACGVESHALVPPGYRFRAADYAMGPSSIETDGGPDIDALLREYLTMIIELRNSERVRAMALRDADLTELARALGGSPDAIEARLRELLGADEQAASELREAILRSTPSSSAPYAGTRRRTR